MRKTDVKNIVFAMKVAMGCIIAIILAMTAGFSYATAAGIITILSIQVTKKETIAVALTRVIAFAVALCISYVTFKLLGFNIYGFGAYVCIYILLCVIFRWQSAMAVNSVLVTHFWAEQSMSVHWILNEVAIFVIGVAIGVIINMSLRFDDEEVDEVKEEIEQDIKNILKRMSLEILNEDKSEYKGDCFERLNAHLDKAYNVAYESVNNTFDNNMKKHLEYIVMRKNQAIVLRNIYENVLVLDFVPKQSYVIAEFIGRLSEHIYEENDVSVNIDELRGIMKDMKNEPLPQSRQEFENRAILWQILYQFEDFLLYKKFLEK